MSWYEMIENGALDVYNGIRQTLLEVAEQITHKSYSIGDLVIGGLIVSVLSGVIIVGLVQYYSFDKKISRRLQNGQLDDRS